MMSVAAQYLGDRAVRTIAVEPAPPGPGEVQIEVAYTGICGTDLHIVHGDMDARVRTPAVLGHEMSGRIVATGPGVDRWAPGDPVTVMPLRWCGTCPVCRAGNTHICRNLDFVGIDSPGSMQRHWTVPQDILVALPAGLDLRAAAIAEPLAVAVHDVRRAELAAGEHALVVGGGPVGFLIALVAQSQGADVTVLEVNPFRRSILERAGMSVVDPTAIDVTGFVDDWTSGAGADVSFEVSGSQQGLSTAIDVLTARGRLVLVGIHSEPRLVDLHQVFWRELSIKGARVYQREDFDSAVALLAGGRVPVDLLISEVVPLANAASAFEALANGAWTMKVLVDCGATP